MMKLFTPHQQRAWDAATRKDKGWTDIQLIAYAGDALYEAIQATSRLAEYRHIIILVGPGHNGDDGLVIASHLATAGYKTIIYSLASSNDTVTRTDLLRMAGESGCLVHPYEEIRRTFHESEASDTPILVIDALFGAGLSRPVEGRYADTVAWLNQLSDQGGAQVFAIDLPSGVSWTTGVHDIRVRADRTYVVQQPQRCALLPYHRSCFGMTHVVDIQLSESYYQQETSFEHWLEPAHDAVVLTQDTAQHMHKYQFGRVGVIAGSQNMLGAGILATHAAMAAGCGAVYAHLPRQGHAALLHHVPEAFTRDQDDQTLIDAIHHPHPSYDAIVVGPGLGKGLGSDVLRQLLERSHASPVVFDADALNTLAQQLHLLPLLGPFAILTPHVREFERLFGSFHEIRERWDCAQRKAQALGCYLLLKGAHSVLFTPDGHRYYHPVANSALAIPGSGDILAGTIAGYCAMGHPPKEAICSAIIAHGIAGGLLRMMHGARGGRASDLIPFLSKMRSYYPTFSDLNRASTYPSLWLEGDDYKAAFHEINKTP